VLIDGQSHRAGNGEGRRKPGGTAAVGTSLAVWNAAVLIVDELPRIIFRFPDKVHALQIIISKIILDNITNIDIFELKFFFVFYKYKSRRW
jgi:hypothetical protein